MCKGDTVHFAASGMEYEVIEVGNAQPRLCLLLTMALLTNALLTMTLLTMEVGTLTPGKQRPTDRLRAGEVGYMHGAIKQARAEPTHGTC